MWFPWWLQHGAMDPLEGTLYGRLSTDLTSELTHFNPGIRLRKGKPSALFRVSRRRSTCWTRCRCAWLHFFLWSTPLSAVRNLLLFQLCSRDRSLSQQHDKVSGHAFRCGTSFFWLSWWGQTVVHPIREDSIAVLCPIWVDRPRSYNGNNAWTL